MIKKVLKPDTYFERIIIIDSNCLYPVSFVHPVPGSAEIKAFITYDPQK